jgi:hypothetical protein
LGKELVTPLDPQAVHELSADVRAAHETDNIAGMWSSEKLLTVGHPAASPTTRCRKIVPEQIGNTFADLPDVDTTAQTWAVQSSRPLNTTMFEATSAAAFHLLKSEELAPASFQATPATSELQNGASGGRGRCLTGGWRVRNALQAEQVSGPGAEKAPGRSQ